MEGNLYADRGQVPPGFVTSPVFIDENTAKLYLVEPWSIGRAPLSAVREVNRINNNTDGNPTYKRPKHQITHYKPSVYIWHSNLYSGLPRKKCMSWMQVEFGAGEKETDEAAQK